jgi:hypothetical protein
MLSPAQEPERGWNMIPFSAPKAQAKSLNEGGT